MPLKFIKKYRRTLGVLWGLTHILAKWVLIFCTWKISKGTYLEAWKKWLGGAQFEASIGQGYYDTKEMKTFNMDDVIL